MDKPLTSRKLRDLKANPENPRTISDEALARLSKSLDKFGDLSGFVYNTKTGLMAGGHQRQKFLLDSEIVIEQTYKKPTKTGTVATGYVIYKGERYSYREVYWDQTTERAANIAANQHGGEFDMPMLSNWMRDLHEINYDFDLTGFAPEELPQFLTPDFNPGSKNEQGRLDKTQTMECPHCGEKFERSEAKIID